ncbi:MAG: hypothetical protein MUF38_06750 [Anaerolineae bacterium]|jgi:hypothetical protein|nr:hypothetical protein [Anaerolineae bacterium]
MVDSPFAEEWRNCLREHYKETAKADDRATLKTLTGILNRVGFREAELQQLYVEATMRADALPDHFIPDVPGVPSVPAEAAAPLENRHPLECQCPSCVERNLTPHDREGQPLAGDALAEAIDRAAWEAEASSDAGDSTPDPDAPQQLSLF